MSAPPKVFISATSGDLRGIRQIVKEALLLLLSNMGVPPVGVWGVPPQTTPLEPRIEGGTPSTPTAATAVLLPNRQRLPPLFPR